jgi:hypothetical protein
MTYLNKSALRCAIVMALTSAQHVQEDPPPELAPEEPEVRQAPRPKSHHERFRVEPRTLSMKSRSRR